MKGESMDYEKRYDIALGLEKLAGWIKKWDRNVESELEYVLVKGLDSIQTEIKACFDRLAAYEKELDKLTLDAVARADKAYIELRDARESLQKRIKLLPNIDASPVYEITRMKDLCEAVDLVGAIPEEQWDRIIRVANIFKKGES